MPLNASTKKNLLRKSKYVDDVQLYRDIPLFSWIDISLTELCNRTCVFCPRADENFYPNQSLHISMDLIKKIANELRDLEYEGAIVLSGFGEPLLHPELLEIVSILSKNARIEIVTNGDVLTPTMLRKLYEANAGRCLISMYDGPEQIEKFKNIISKSKVPEDFVILRDRWYDDTQNFGVKLTNRTGTVKTGNQLENSVHGICYYPSYQFLIDWNGDIFLCPQDWQRRKAMGNMRFLV